MQKNQLKTNPKTAKRNAAADASKRKYTLEPEEIKRRLQSFYTDKVEPELKWEKIERRLRNIDVKTQLLPALLYCFLFYFIDKVGQAYRYTEGLSTMERFFTLVSSFPDVFKQPMLSFHLFDLLFAFFGTLIIRTFIYVKSKSAKKFRKGKEYGSARWGTREDILPFMDTRNFKNNIPLTATEALTMSSHANPPKNARNKNIVVIGGSGSGKTRFFVKPSLMQMHSSYVVTDPKGTLLVECGQMFENNGYRIKVLNTINFKKSMHYNPFSYIRSEKDILKLVNALIANTKGDGERSGEDFWVKAERLLYTALISYIWYEAPEGEKNFATLLEMLRASEVHEDDESYKNAVDMMFDELEEKEPDHFAVQQYKLYKQAAGKTAKSILISCGARLAPFNIRELRELTDYDEMELETLGEYKSALFIIISDTDDTFNFVAALLYTQMFNLLCDRADDKYNGKLPIHVRCLLDEFANIGQIPKFEKLIATIRSREISACIILQAKSQLKAIYKEHADTIIGNCDAMLFLGGSEEGTLKDLSEILGKETIDTYNTSENKGREESHNLSYQKLGRELMTKDELSVMDGGKCILRIRGVRPFLSDKYDITKHPQYKNLSDYDPKNAFDTERFITRRPKVRSDAEVDVFEDFFSDENESNDNNESEE